MHEILHPRLYHYFYTITNFEIINSEITWFQPKDPELYPPSSYSTYEIIFDILLLLLSCELNLTHF